MDYLWTPWRYAFITAPARTVGCVFCELQKKSDEEALVVHRGRHCYVVLNAFPYTSGHVLAVPYAHLDRLENLPQEAAHEMMDLARKMEGILRATYNPQGVNLGMNIGEAAGAGIAGHIHLHVLPRWVADANFISVVGETRVLPEDLKTTWRRLREAFAKG
jgi:ATP adenylyltransferase